MSNSDVRTAEGDSVASASDSWRLHNPDEQVFTHHVHRVFRGSYFFRMTVYLDKDGALR